MTAPAKVLYIGGFGRSGSTLVERVLGQLPGFASVGEVVFIWERALKKDQLCGCGQAFSQCEFWAQVGKAAFDGWDNVDAEAMIALKHEVDRNRYIPAMVAPRLRPRAHKALDQYTEALSKLYGGIRDASGARVVIDASKHASTAFLLRKVDGVDARVVHLVRDSRGVAYSWTKEVRKPEVTGEDDYMPVYSPASSGRQWVQYNLLFDALKAVGQPRPMLLRYESFLADPRSAMERILAFAGEPVAHDAFSFLGDGYVELGTDHTVAGNPMRFKTGRLELRLDAAWTSELPSKDRKVVTAITWPLHLLYGYRNRTKNAR